MPLLQCLLDWLSRSYPIPMVRAWFPHISSPGLFFINFWEYPCHNEDQDKVGEYFVEIACLMLSITKMLL